MQKYRGALLFYYLLLEINVAGAIGIAGRLLERVVAGKEAAADSGRVPRAGSVVASAFKLLASQPLLLPDPKLGI